LLLFLFDALGIVLTERCTQELFEFYSQRHHSAPVIAFAISLNENEVGVVVV
jgi:hypothetical protein